MALRALREGDLPALYQHQRDPEALRQAAFTGRDREAFLEHWHRILADDTVVKRCILYRGEAAGHIVVFEQDGLPLVGYWLDRACWGRGVATEALGQLLRQIDTRPLYAFVAEHNLGSIRVLEKCGFEPSSRVDVEEGELFYELTG